MTEAAAVLGALGAAALVLASSRAVLAAAVALVAAAMAALAASGGGELDSLERLFESPAGLAALALGLAALVALAAVLARWPVAILPALLLVAPLRLPVETDPDSPVLLSVAGAGGLGRVYPLYAVLGASLLALAWRLRREPLARTPSRAITVPAAAFLALVVLSALWAEDEPAARTELLFTWLPFALLLAVAARAPLEPRSPRLLAVTLVAEATLFAAVALVQAASERLVFYTVSLQQANELTGLFRVTAAFQDPNHLGRHLVLAIVVVLVVAWAIRLSLRATALLLGLLGAGLWFTYSQSSAVTLAAVALAIGLVLATGTPRRLVAAATATLAVGAVVSVAVLLGSGSAASATSDRSTLVGDTAAVAARHPVAGVGVASQPLVTQREEAPEASKLQSVSHTTPLTVAAELGVPGVALLVALVIGAARALVDLMRTDRALAAGLGAVLLALAVHSLFYGGLFENPLTWGALGVAAGAAGRAPAEATAAPRAPQAALRS